MKEGRETEHMGEEEKRGVAGATTESSSGNNAPLLKVFCKPLFLKGGVYV